MYFVIFPAHKGSPTPYQPTCPVPFPVIAAAAHNFLSSSIYSCKANSWMACMLPQISIQRQNGVSCNYVIFICRSGGQACEEFWETEPCLPTSPVMSSEKHEGHLCTSQLHIPFAGYSLGFVLLNCILFICLQFKRAVPSLPAQ